METQDTVVEVVDTDELAELNRKLEAVFANDKHLMAYDALSDLQEISKTMDSRRFDALTDAQCVLITKAANRLSKLLR